ncbi:hypothetical protein D3C81_1215890 [compost metagenome]
MGRHPAAADLLQQGLGNHRLQRFGKHRANHGFFFGGEHVDDTVDGLGRRGGVQGAEYQVAGFRRGQRQADGFQVAHFADQDDVRVFPQRRTQRLVEAEGVAVHLALVDQALLRFVDEFDRVFDGKNVAVLGVVQVVEQRRQRGGLTRTGRPGDQHQPARYVGDTLEGFAQTEVLHGQHLGGNGPEHRAGATVLVERVDPETRHARHFEGEVGFEEFLEILALLVVHDVVDQRVHLLVIERRQVDPAHIAIDTDHRRQTGREVQVRSALFGAEGEQLGNIHGTPQSNASR